MLGHDAWYEMYPSGVVEVPITVSPGDTISASVQYVTSGLEAGRFDFRSTISAGRTNPLRLTNRIVRRIVPAEWIAECAQWHPAPGAVRDAEVFRRLGRP